MAHFIIIKKDFAQIGLCFSTRDGSLFMRRKIVVYFKPLHKYS